MNPKSAERFVTPDGTEVSVRTSRDIATDALMIEPLYATDIELLDGATGELHAQGQTLRGTLRRNGGVFMFDSAQPRPRVTRKRRETTPSAVPVAPIVETPEAEPVKQADQSTTSDADALEAADTLVRFVRGERGVALKAAQRAQAVIGRFIAERERQARARK